MTPHASRKPDIRTMSSHSEGGVPGTCKLLYGYAEIIRPREGIAADPADDDEHARDLQVVQQGLERGCIIRPAREHDSRLAFAEQLGVEAGRARRAVQVVVPAEREPDVAGDAALSDRDGQTALGTVMRRAHQPALDRFEHVALEIAGTTQVECRRRSQVVRTPEPIRKVLRAAEVFDRALPPATGSLGQELPAVLLPTQVQRMRWPERVGHARYGRHVEHQHHVALGHEAARWDLRTVLDQAEHPDDGRGFDG